jgi:hypothetical protein
MAFSGLTRFTALIRCTHKLTSKGKNAMQLPLYIFLVSMLSLAVLLFAAPLGALAIVPWIASLLLGFRLISKFVTISEV